MRRDQACRAIIEHTIDLITFIDLNGEILLESPSVERLLGYLPAERSGRSIFDPIHPDDLPKARAAFQAALTCHHEFAPGECPDLFTFLRAYGLQSPRHWITFGLCPPCVWRADRNERIAAVVRRLFPGAKEIAPPHPTTYAIP